LLVFVGAVVFASGALFVVVLVAELPQETPNIARKHSEVTNGTRLLEFFKIIS
jgi:hypothetical protein